MSEAETLQAQTEVLRALIETEGDVRALLRLEPLPDWTPPRWAYLIETPFMTFPKFCVGMTNADNTEVHVVSKCGLRNSAEEAFAILKLQPAKEDVPC